VGEVVGGDEECGGVYEYSTVGVDLGYEDVG